MQPEGFSSSTTPSMPLFESLLFLYSATSKTIQYKGLALFSWTLWVSPNAQNLILLLNINIENKTRMLDWTCDPAYNLKKSWYNPYIPNFISAQYLYRKTLLLARLTVLSRGVIKEGCQPADTYLTIENLPSEYILQLL